MKDHKKEFKSIIKISMISFLILILGVILKIYFDSPTANYFLVVTTVFLMPVLLTAFSQNKITTPKQNIIFYFMYIVATGIGLSLTSFQDISTYCEGGSSTACLKSTLAVLTIYIIISIGVALGNYDKDKEFNNIKKNNITLEEELKKANQDYVNLEKKLQKVNQGYFEFKNENAELQEKLNKDFNKRKQLIFKFGKIEIRINRSER